MRRRLPVALAALIALNAAGAAPRPPKSDVMVFGSAVDAAAGYSAPTADQPQTYVLALHPFTELGSARREKPPPPPDAVERAVRDTLARAHFVAARPEDGGLDLAIACYFGTINRTVVSGGNVFMPAGDPGMVGINLPPGQAGPSMAQMSQSAALALQAAGDLNARSVMLNETELVKIVAGDSLARMRRYDPDRERIEQEINTDRYFVVLCAYDGADVLAKRPKRLLWRTQMSVDSVGTNLADALPALLHAGRPFLARATEKPAAVNLRLRRGEVIIEPAEMSDYEEPAKAPRSDPR